MNPSAFIALSNKNKDFSIFLRPYWQVLSLCF